MRDARLGRAACTAFLQVLRVQRHSRQAVSAKARHFGGDERARCRFSHGN
jgi:hypothetical protein